MGDRIELTHYYTVVLHKGASGGRWDDGNEELAGKRGDDIYRGMPYELTDKVSSSACSVAFQEGRCKRD